MRVSQSTVRRLSNYYRVLDQVAAENRGVISSNELAEHEGITSAQVRKDLSYFGAFGRRGLGYNVERLRAEIRAILGLDRRWRVGVAGSGHLGSALLAYRGFGNQGFDIVAVFDADRSRIGTEAGLLQVRDIDSLSLADRLDMGVIATPVGAAQDVADRFVAAGVRGILNFAPRKLRVPENVTVRAVDMTTMFESLSFALTEQRPLRVPKSTARRTPPEA